jgi:hypothetical protein
MGLGFGDGKRHGRGQDAGEWRGREVARTGRKEDEPGVGYSNSETKENDRGILLTERI